jgi:queuine tRNA-ribosyltransferase
MNKVLEDNKTFFNFKVEHKDKNCPARACTITTPHSEIKTPVFMPVGTHGAIKALQPHQLLTAMPEPTSIILSNTYHLHLTPGPTLIKKAGGLHKFMGWPKSLLTDSGGFQVFSLKNKTITEDGVTFQSPKGEKVFLSPENSIQIQENLGADIMMAFDECIPYPATEKYASDSIQRTHRWLERSIQSWTNPQQSLFGIVQGSVYPNLRKICAEIVGSHNLPGNAIGGVSVGEGPEFMEEIVSLTAPLLPFEKPKYVMGVGNPEDLLMLWENGVDMSDCIIPTKFARGGTLFTNRGKIRITHKNYRHDFYPVEPNCVCYTCKNFSRSYLKHLFDSNEILGAILTTIHNLAFYQQLAIDARKAIFENRFLEFKKNFLSQYQK